MALVTGANHGIGAAIAAALAAGGADVAITSWRPFAEESGADQPAEYVRPAPASRRRGRRDDRGGVAPRALHVEADLTDTTVPAMLFDRVERALGPVEVLVHNASGWRKDSFADRRRRDPGARCSRRCTSTPGPVCC